MNGNFNMSLVLTIYEASIGGWWVCDGEEVQLGTADGTPDLVADPFCVPAKFKITDVNVTAANFC